MCDQRNFGVAILAVIIIGLMTCSLPQPGGIQLLADVSKAEPDGCIEDVSVVSELARVSDVGDESADSGMSIEPLAEPTSRDWVIQRCTALRGDEARLFEIAFSVDVRGVS